MSEILDRSEMRVLQCTDADLHILANGQADHHKKRLQLVFDDSTDACMVGCFNGHSLPVADPDRELIRRPTYFVHGTNWGAATSILRQGPKSVGRKEIHLVPLHMSARQEAYVKPDGKNTHLLVVDGAIASAAGITSFKLENDVIVTKGLMGYIPPCCIASLWKNTKAGRFRLNLEESLQVPPTEKETTELPEYVPPPLLIRGCVPSDQATSPITPVTSKETPVVLRARHIPLREYTPQSMPEVPSLTQSDDERRLSLSPTPSQPRLPETQRPPPWTLSPPRGSAVTPQQRRPPTRSMIGTMKQPFQVSTRMINVHTFDHHKYARNAARLSRKFASPLSA